MDAITGFFSAHPAILTSITIFAVIIILYFIFKQMIKLALILLLIVLVVVGYYYFQNPNKMSENIKNPIDTVKSGTNEVMEKSKSLYRESKKLIDKAIDMTGDINKLFKGTEDKAEK
jgi:hypothetical protein